MFTRTSDVPNSSGRLTCSGTQLSFLFFYSRALATPSGVTREAVEVRVARWTLILDGTRDDSRNPFEGTSPNAVHRWSNGPRKLSVRLRVTLSGCTFLRYVTELQYIIRRPDRVFIRLRVCRRTQSNKCFDAQGFPSRRSELLRRRKRKIH